MEGRSFLEALLQQILNPNNQERNAAEQELARLGATPEFVIQLTAYCCEAANCQPSVPSQRSLYLVAFSVLSRSLQEVDHWVVLQQTSQVILSHLSRVIPGLDADDEVAVENEDWVARQWATVLVSICDRLWCASQVESTREVVTPLAHDVFASVQNYITDALLHASFESACQLGKVRDCVTLLLTLFSSGKCFVTAFCKPISSECSGILLSILTSPLLPEKIGCLPSPNPRLHRWFQLKTTAANALQMLYQWAFTSRQEKQTQRFLRDQYVSHCEDLLSNVCMSFTAVRLGKGWDVQLEITMLQALFHTVAFTSDVFRVTELVKPRKDIVWTQLFQGIVASLETDAPLYTVLNSEENGCRDEGQISVLFRSHVMQLWLVFADLITHPSVQSKLTTSPLADYGSRVYSLMLRYAMLPADVSIAWCANPEIFVRDEEECHDDICHTTRNAVSHVLSECIVAFSPSFFHNVLEDLHTRLFVADTEDVGLPWQRREVALFLMEVILRRRAKELRLCGDANFLPVGSQVLERDVASTNPVVAVRALALLSVVVRYTAAEEERAGLNTKVDLSTFSNLLAQRTVGFLSLSVQSSAEEVSLLRVGVCMFLRESLVYWPHAVLEQAFYGLQGALLELQTHSKEAGFVEESLYLLLDVLRCLVKTMRRYSRRALLSLPVTLHPSFPRVVFQCWRDHSADPNVGELALSLLKYCVADAGGDAAILQEMTWVKEVLCGYGSSMAEWCSLPHFIDLLRYIFLSGSEKIANGVADLILDNLCELLLWVEDSAIVAASCRCLASLLHRCPQAESVEVRVIPSLITTVTSSGAVLPSINTDPQRQVFSFSSVIAAIILHMLDEQMEESALLEVGNPLVTIIQHADHFKEEEIVRIIHAIVFRLRVVRSELVSNELFAPLSLVLQLHPSTFLQILVRDGILIEVMTLWLPRVEQCSDHEVGLMSCDGLLRLLELLSNPHASVEAKQLAQEPITCQWVLPLAVACPEGTATCESGAAKVSVRRAKQRGIGTRKANSSSGAVEVSVTLPLHIAIFVSVGRGLLPLLDPLVCLSLHRTVEKTSTFEDSSSDEELFSEDEDAAEEWMDGVDDFDEDNGNVSVGDAHETVDAPVVPEECRPEEASEATKRRLLGPLLVKLTSFFPMCGSSGGAYFTRSEADELLSYMPTTV